MIWVIVLSMVCSYHKSLAPLKGLSGMPIHANKVRRELARSGGAGLGSISSSNRLQLACREHPSFFAVGRALGLHHQTVQRCVERAVAQVRWLRSTIALVPAGNR